MAISEKDGHVPAPPTRTEEPETLTGEDMRRLRRIHGYMSLTNRALDRLEFLEAERDRLREQIETMRDYLDQWRDSKSNRDKFNALFPPERP